MFFYRWGLLFGFNKVFDLIRFFIFCGNVIGLFYGIIFSVIINFEIGKFFGFEMFGSSVKDDVWYVMFIY